MSTSSSSSLPNLRRHSQPPLPTPGSGLRAALLGYLGEVEASIRGRLGVISGQEGESEQIRSDSSSASEGVSEGFETDLDVGESSGVGSSRQQGDLRYRGKQPSTYTDDNIESSSTSTSTTHRTRPRAFSSQDALLSHLSWLREDILASLPPAVLSAPSSSREWLRALPARLSAVERNLWADNSSPSAKISAEGAVETARRKLLDIVKAALPTDEWEGWERLGWEETDRFPPIRPALGRLGSSADRAKEGEAEDDVEVGEEEEEEEEGNLLFPNRTPAAAQAIASRRRTIRSVSLGAAGRPGRWADLHRDSIDGEVAAAILPKLQRMRTMPNILSDRRTTLDDEDSEGEIQILDGGKGIATDALSGNLYPIGQDGLRVIQGKGKARSRSASAAGLGPSVAEALSLSEDGEKLITYDDLPVEWRNNEHIFTGYRFIPLHASTGPIPLIKSAFSWHNETINIHSHFIPSVALTLVIPFIVYSTPLPDAHILDTAVLILYLIAAISCLFTSAEWHVLSGCASRKWMEWGACVDYVGISWLIAASFGTVVYNAFYCQPKAVLLYCSTNAACGALGSYLPFQKWFNQRRMKPYRIAFFLFLNFAMFAPMIQLWFTYGWAKASEFSSPFVPSILAYFVGLLFYAFHFPECIFPGKFDHLFHSHQVWHVGIVIAIALHYKAVFEIHAMRYDYSCAVPGAGRTVSAVVEGWWRDLVG